MSASAIFKAWVPPAARRLFAARRGRRYADSARARAACASLGYSDEALVETVARKTLRYARATLADTTSGTDGRATRRAGQFELQILAALSLAATASGEVRVLDFGGACGVGFFAVRSLLPPGIALNWHVLETPTMTAAARRVLGEVPGLSFASDLDELGDDAAGRFDLLYSSCALPFTPEPLAFLDRLLALGVPNVAFTRMILTEHAESFSIVFRTSLHANGPGVPDGMIAEVEPLPTDALLSYPCTFTSRRAFERRVSQQYELLFAADDPAASVPVIGRATVGMSYFGRLRRSPLSERRR